MKVDSIAVIIVLSAAAIANNNLPTINIDVHKPTCNKVEYIHTLPDPPDYITKITCPKTEPAHFLTTEVTTELWTITGYSVGDDFTPGRNVSDGWQLGINREVRPGITAACPEELELGTMIIIDKIGPRVCEDRGSAIVGKRIDVAFSLPEAAIAWGVRRVRVAIIRP